MLKLYENIKLLRISYKWSQDDLAAKVGYSDKSMISKIEHGLVDLSQSQIQRFADVFGVPAPVLFGEPSAAVVSSSAASPFSPDELALIRDYNKLNELGKEEARKRIAELAEIQKYIEDDYKKGEAKSV